MTSTGEVSVRGPTYVRFDAAAEEVPRCEGHRGDVQPEDVSAVVGVAVVAHHGQTVVRREGREECESSLVQAGQRPRIAGRRGLVVMCSVVQLRVVPHDQVHAFGHPGLDLGPRVPGHGLLGQRRGEALVLPEMGDRGGAPGSDHIGEQAQGGDLAGGDEIVVGPEQAAGCRARERLAYAWNGQAFEARLYFSDKARFPEILQEREALVERVFGPHAIDHQDKGLFRRGGDLLPRLGHRIAGRQEAMDGQEKAEEQDGDDEESYGA